ncbi:MAG: hypothetical protein JXJ04_05770 [Spirochaetales bacterium]|nr:hypothetical protein [Spirochaetales bacterium]
MRNFIIIMLLMASFTGFADTVTLNEAGLSLYIPEGWEQGFSDDDGAYYANDPGGEMFIIAGIVGKSELMYAERSSIINKVIMEWGLSFEVSEEEETEINGIPMSVAYGSGMYKELMTGGSIMLLEVEDADYMGLVMIFGTEKAWDLYVEAITEVFMSFNTLK